MLLSTHVQNVLPHMPLDRRRHVENAMIDMTLRLCDARGFSAFIKPMGVRPAQVKVLKQRIYSDFNLGPRLKYAMVWIARRPSVMKNTERMVDGFAQFGLDASHVEAFERLREQQLISAFIRKSKDAPLDIESAMHAERVCDRAVDACAVFTRKFVIKKMRFIAKANNESVDPIIQDLLEVAASMFYEISPWLTWEHSVNYLKRTIHSRGINRIKYETTETRKRLIGEAGAHENRMVSYDALTASAWRSDDGTMTGALAEIEAQGMRAIESPMAYHEIKTTFGKLVDNFAGKPRKQTAVRLLAMHDIPGFIELAQHESGNPTIMSTEDVLEELGVTAFHSLIRKFVGATDAAFAKFIIALQNEFEGVH